MSHYTMDCFYRDDEGRLRPVRRETRRLLAYDERSAISEAERVAISAQPAYFEVHSTAPMRRVVYMSTVKDAIPKPAPGTGI